MFLKTTCQKSFVETTKTYPGALRWHWLISFACPGIEFLPSPWRALGGQESTRCGRLWPLERWCRGAETRSNPGSGYQRLSPRFLRSRHFRPRKGFRVSLEPTEGWTQLQSGDGTESKADLPRSRLSMPWILQHNINREWVFKGRRTQKIVFL